MLHDCSLGAILQQQPPLSSELDVMRVVAVDIVSSFLLPTYGMNAEMKEEKKLQV